MAKNSKRSKVRMESTANTGYFYTTTVNEHTRNVEGKGKLELRKFDPVAKKHVVFKQKKI